MDGLTGKGKWKRNGGKNDNRLSQNDRLNTAPAESADIVEDFVCCIGGHVPSLGIGYNSRGR